MLLLDRPCAEFGATEAVSRCGGVVIQPWRAAWLAARAAGLQVHVDAGDLPDGLVEQAVVHVQKSRPGTWQDLAEAWRLLRPGGRLLLCGGNDLGIVSAVRRLAAETDQVGTLLANRARARVVAWQRDSGSGPEAPVTVEVPWPTLPRPLLTVPGTFAHGRIDTGSRLLLSALGERSAPRMVLDLAAGTGLLGCIAGLRWPEATLQFAEADHRALVCLERNLARCGLAARARASWWDAAEPAPGAGAELILINPPCHVGKTVDLGPARQIFAQLPRLCAFCGEALIVANRQLPYEQTLASLGACRVLDQEGPFKLLCWRPEPDHSR